MTEKMINIALTKEEIDKIIAMIEGSSIQMTHAEEALKLLNKFKGAK